MQTQSSLTLDLHGKNVYQAKIAIDAALRRAKGIYRLSLIHGYHQGDAIKAMILETYSLHPQVLELREDKNPGCTLLILRKL